MSEDGAVNDLHTLDAVASENGALLSFRMDEETEELEPVFMRFFSANTGEENEVALIDIADQAGLPLGRYVINRRRLELALVRAVDVDEGAPEPAVVPADWER